MTTEIKAKNTRLTAQTSIFKSKLEEIFNLLLHSEKILTENATNVEEPD
jgi:hypothetical protein